MYLLWTRLQNIYLILIRHFPGIFPFIYMLKKNWVISIKPLHSHLIKGVRCGWHELLTLTVMPEVPSEALKSGNLERIILCAQTVSPTISKLPSSRLLPVALWTEIRKSQPFPLSKIWPRSSDRLKLWSRKYSVVPFGSAIANHFNEHLTGN